MRDAPTATLCCEVQSTTLCGHDARRAAKKQARVSRDAGTAGDKRVTPAAQNSLGGRVKSLDTWPILKVESFPGGADRQQVASVRPRSPEFPRPCLVSSTLCVENRDGDHG
jgi:hypothetical protein